MPRPSASKVCHDTNLWIYSNYIPTARQSRSKLSHDTNLGIHSNNIPTAGPFESILWHTRTSGYIQNKGLVLNVVPNASSNDIISSRAEYTDTKEHHGVYN